MSESHEINKYDTVTEDDIAVLKAFHGHLGPYVFCGLRAGRYALKELNADPHFGIEADIHCPGHTPQSCFIDGIQISTGCTLGKMNVRHHDADEIKACFTNCDSGDTLCLQLRDEAIAEAVEVMKEQDDEAGAAVIMDMADDDLLQEVPSQ